MLEIDFMNYKLEMTFRKTEGYRVYYSKLLSTEIQNKLFQFPNI